MKTLSSSPFYLGIPVVDKLEAKDGSFVLRTRNRKEAYDEVERIRTILTKRDVIKTYSIGFRPDKPVPVSMFFTEVNIGIGKAKDWNLCFGALVLGWSNVLVGIKEE